MIAKHPKRHLQQSTAAILMVLLFISSVLVTELADAASGNKTSAFLLVRMANRSITGHEAQFHVDVLASDKLQGRETGKPGQWLAAKYIADEFSKYGLQTIGSGHKYYQDFQLERRDLDEAGFWLEYVTHQSHNRIRFSLKDDFIPFEFTGENKVTASLVFAGYGITAPEYNYDDYQDIDVQGKIVLVLRHEPQENNPQSIFAGTRLTKHSHFEKKAQNAWSHGARGLLLVTDPAGGHHTLLPQGSWPSLESNGKRAQRWRFRRSKSQERFPVAWISLDAALKILANSHTSLRDLQIAIDKSLKPKSFEIQNVTAHLRVSLKKEVRKTQNVLGLLEGSDPDLKHEVVVVGAHYDHLGLIRGKVHHGADDNASGTAGMLEVAEAFSEIPVKPRRSILFIAFTAEELGLLGSKFYVNHALFPLEDTVAMLNLDMISRNAPNEVSVIGANRSPELHDINIAANKLIGLDLKYNGEKYFSRSDHANFAKHRIPVLFYNTEGHSDYHRATDLPQKVNAEKLSRIARLTFLVAWEIANSDRRPTYRPLKIR